MKDQSRIEKSNRVNAIVSKGNASKGPVRRSQGFRGLKPTEVNKKKGNVGDASPAATKKSVRKIAVGEFVE